MELSPEGLAVAAATREAAQKRKPEKSPAPADARPAAKKASSLPRIRPPCTHEVALPNGFDINSIQLDPAIHGTLEAPLLATNTRAKQYPFVLDPFQETAVACLERRESVLVAAHTSAGKTVVAEYAIAMAFRDKQRVIYTSPLKALSNQKFRELSEEFGDVGLMTGDVSLNPNASCIVMTTEILRSMIYRGSELLREVAWVVFDEVHYMQDRERGVVWEETIIFLPDDAKMVFLSATLSNASQFAAWVAHLHKQPCHVVYTDYRPTPLHHYAYALGSKGMHLILDDRGSFKTDNWQKVRSVFEVEKALGEGQEGGEAQDAGRGAPGRGRGGRGGRGRGGRGGGRDGGRGGRGDAGKGMAMHIEVANMLAAIQMKSWQPAIFFAFSRKDCEMYAGAMKTFDFNKDSDEDKAAVEEVFNNAVQCLSEEDRKLPAIHMMLPMLQRGIGVHHSGLLPILKEVIEILFQEGLVKVLFTTETFAMGLNMPARTVVFTQLRKWDGEQQRLMTSGEYIQMSGRAGRRGKDDKGIAIMMVAEDVDEAAVRNMCQGKPSPLMSSFKLSYYTMLNMLRRMEGGDSSMEFVIRNSFQQFQQERQLPEVEQQLREVEARMADLGHQGQAALDEYVDLNQQIAEQRVELQGHVLQPQRCLPFLQAGRVVHVVDGEVDWGWAVLVSVMWRPEGHGAAAAAADPGPGGGEGRGPGLWVADTLLVCDSTSIAAGAPAPAHKGCVTAEMVVVSVALELLAALSALRLTIPQNLAAADARRAVMLQLQDVCAKFPDGPPLLDPVEDMGIRDPGLLTAMDRVQQLEQRLAKNAVFQAQGDATKFAAFAAKAALAQQAEQLRLQLRTSQLAVFREEARNRTAVLKRLGHLDEEGIVVLKGRAACEIDTADELLSTELLFNGTLLGLDIHSLVALCSCLIPVEKSGEFIKLTTTMAGPLAALQETARKIAEVSRECKLEVDPDTYVEAFKPFLMDIMYSWSKGASFAEICGMTDIYEGSIIRATRRLDELLQQLAQAAKVVGDTDLAAHIEKANNTIRRDIIFAASLYI
ncbi:HUA enhancer 2 [Haematococcus lacustris]